MVDSHNWIQRATIYEVYPLTFRHGKNGGVGSDPHYGNLSGIIEKLDYIQSLSVDAIWLAPIFQSPLSDGFGYNVSDYKKIHPVFGNDADFDRLVEEAHARGIKVMLDMVFSHTSDQHEWFTESAKSRQNPYADFYIWADPVYDAAGERQVPNNWLSMDLQKPSAWQWSESRQQYYLHSFHHSMPSLNIANPAVEEKLFDVARYWLDRGVDGFRMDAVSHMGYDKSLTNNPTFNTSTGYHGQYHKHTMAQRDAVVFLKNLKTMLAAYPRRTLPTEPDLEYQPALLGEVMNVPDFATHLIQENALDLVFNGNLTGNLFNFRQIVEHTFHHCGGVRNAWAMSSHDTERILDRTIGCEARPEHAVLYAGMLACLPGSVILFQGDELGLRHDALEHIKKRDPLNLFQSFMGSNDACRAGMPWIDGANNSLYLMPVKANRQLAPEFQEDSPKSPLEQIRTLLNLRRNDPALQSLSPPIFVNTHDPDVLVVIRQDEETKAGMICSFNFGQRAKKLVFYHHGENVMTFVCPALATNFVPFSHELKNLHDITMNCFETSAQLKPRLTPKSKPALKRAACG